MSAQHTPGPWSVPHFADNSTPCECAYVLSESQHSMGAICEVRHGGEDEPLEIAQANARLIAAAPDLWAIVETIAKLIDQCAPTSMILDENSPTTDAIRDAVVKVTGSAS